MDKRTKMLKLAIEALEMRRKAFVVGKSTNEKLPGKFEFAIKDSKRYDELTEAIEYWKADPFRTSKG